MAQFVLEVGTEEMPARFLPELENNMEDLVGKALLQEWIDYNAIRTYATPRRLVVWIAEIKDVQEEREEIITGPPIAIAYDENGDLSKAGLGFAKKQGLGPEALFVHETQKGKYLALKKRLGGQQSALLLPNICTSLLKNLFFPKKMRWEFSNLTFGRPIRWLLALLDKEILPVKAASIVADRYTWGHRVMGPGPWEIPSAGDFFDILAGKGHVILDVGQRKERVQEQGNSLAQARNGTIVWNEALLDEVSNLVEYPKPIMGSFDLSYLHLPREVLLTSMETHQKCFGVEDGDGHMLPYFLCTLNIEPRDKDLVTKGWERVLKARLEDAAFFWNVDTKTSLETWSQELYKVVFLGPLGSMGEKTQRLKEIAAYLAQHLSPQLEADVVRSAYLAKTDLVSEMVGEFAELQGIMGGIYARYNGESDIVSKAIYEQYLPTGQESPVPQTLAGALLSLAEKGDNLVGCFGLQMIPTGTHDPYALRRQSLGILRIILSHELRFSLQSFLQKVLAIYGQREWKLSAEELVNTLLDFFGQRIRVFCTSQGFETRTVEAAIGAGFDNVLLFYLRLQALSRFSQEEDFENAVLSFKRLDNILRKQVEAGDFIDGRYNQSDFEEPEEKELVNFWEHIRPQWNELWEQENFDHLFALLRELRPYVDNFFDQVMVMAKDADLRRNRLNLLKNIVDKLGKLAEFGSLQV
jgi:glycyl-tRNA synthetase beta chain